MMAESKLACDLATDGGKRDMAFAADPNQAIFFKRRKAMVTAGGELRANALMWRR